MFAASRRELQAGGLCSPDTGNILAIDTLRVPRAETTRHPMLRAFSDNDNNVLFGMADAVL
jgi:hypothetical protein